MVYRQRTCDCSNFYRDLWHISSLTQLSELCKPRGVSPTTSLRRKGRIILFSAVHMRPSTNWHWHVLISLAVHGTVTWQLDMCKARNDIFENVSQKFCVLMYSATIRLKFSSPISAWIILRFTVKVSISLKYFIVRTLGMNRLSR